MKNTLKVLLALSFLAGIIVGIVVTYALFYAFISNSIASILGHISIENVNFNINETALVEQMNQTFSNNMRA